MRSPMSMLLGLALLAVLPGCLHPCCDVGRGCDMGRVCSQNMDCGETQPLCCPRGPDAECHGFKRTEWQPWPCDDGYAMQESYSSPSMMPTPAEPMDAPPAPKQVRREPKLKRTAAKPQRTSRPVAPRTTDRQPPQQAAQPKKTNPLAQVAGVKETPAAATNAHSKNIVDSAVQPVCFVEPVAAVAVEKPAVRTPLQIFKAGPETVATATAASEPVATNRSDAFLDADEADDLPPAMPALTPRVSAEDESDDPAPVPVPALRPVTRSTGGWKARS